MKSLKRHLALGTEQRGISVVCMNTKLAQLITEGYLMTLLF